MIQPPPPDLAAGGQPPADPTRSDAAAALAQANASLALDGIFVDAAQAARQQQVARGELSFQAAIDLAIAQAKADASAAPGTGPQDASR